MPKIYEVKRAKQEKVSKTCGIVFSVLAHAIVIGLGAIHGLIYIYPPPMEESILIDFSEDIPRRQEIIRTGAQPQTDNPDPNKEIELVQKSEGLAIGTKLNEAEEASVDEFGDVEVTKPKEKQIDKRALFHSAKNNSNKDTLSAQTASKITEKLKAGHAEGNTLLGKTNSKPNANLNGRKVVGSLPSPKYGVQASGKVVVEIWVDQYGKVKKAIAGADGTTVTDKNLWNAARIAALDAHFNMSGDAPTLQKGSITYIFNLK